MTEAENLPEAAKAATGFSYLHAGVTAASGLTSLAGWPRFTGFARLAGAAALVWVGSKPSSERLQVASGVSVGLAAVDAASLFAPSTSAAGRIRGIASTVLNLGMAVLHRQAAIDLSD